MWSAGNKVAAVILLLIHARAIAKALRQASRTYMPSPKQLAATVKPLIQQELHKKHERNGTVLSVTLEQKGGKVYVGFVEVALGERSEQFLTQKVEWWPLEVVYNNGNLLWEFKHPDGHRPLNEGIQAPNRFMSR
jgi:hypothetical protein